MTRVVLLYDHSVCGNIPGQSQSANVPPAATPASPLARGASCDRYSADRASIARRYPAEYSPERYARLTRFYKDWQQELAKLPFEPLNVEGRIDHVLLTARLQYELRLLAREQSWVNDTARLMPFAKDDYRSVEARGRLDAMDPEQAAGTLDQITRDIEVRPNAFKASKSFTRFAQETGDPD